jgi:hypothetical protein
MAQKLGAQLSADRKIMLGVQLYDLISQAGLKQEQGRCVLFVHVAMGMAAQAIDIVYQLNARKIPIRRSTNTARPRSNRSLSERTERQM